MTSCFKSTSIFYLIILFSLPLSISTFGQVSQLSEKAMNADLFTEDGKTLTLSEVLERYPDQKIFIDLWASWCKDCIVGFPKVKELQGKFDETVFLYLSVDKKEDEWRKGIERFNIEGTHFRVDKGWESDLCESVDLDWIPRYMIVDSSGKILHFKSIEADDKPLKKALKLSQL